MKTGEHLVNVKARGRHIPGSPFKVLVEAPSGGAAACKASGPGLEGGISGQPCRFTVITRDAGPGGMSFVLCFYNQQLTSDKTHNNYSTQ